MTTPNIPPTPPEVPKSSGITMGVAQLFGIFFGFALIIAVAFWLGGKKSNTDLENYRDEVKTYIDSAVAPTLRVSDSIRAVNKTLIEFADSARSESGKKTQQIKLLQSNLNQVRIQNKRLVDSVLSDTTLPPACDQCRLALTKVKFEVDSLVLLNTEYQNRDVDRRTEIGTLRTLLSNVQYDADTLRTIVINFPEPPKAKKFLGIKFPHIPPGYYYAAGVVTGIVIVKK